MASQLSTRAETVFMTLMDRILSFGLNKCDEWHETVILSVYSQLCELHAAARVHAYGNR